MSAWLDRFAWWQRATPRERVLLAVGTLVVGFAITWLVIWEPAARDLARMASDAPHERATLAAARSQASEIAAIVSTPARGTTDLRGSVEAALAQRGLTVAPGGVELREGRVRVVLAAARFDALIAALGALERDAGLRVAEATLTARVEPGTVRAELTLVR